MCIRKKMQIIRDVWCGMRNSMVALLWIIRKVGHIRMGSEDMGMVSSSPCGRPDTWPLLWPISLSFQEWQATAAAVPGNLRTAGTNCSQRSQCKCLIDNQVPRGRVWPYRRAERQDDFEGAVAFVALWGQLLCADVPPALYWQWALPEQSRCCAA